MAELYAIVGILAFGAGLFVGLGLSGNPVIRAYMDDDR